MQFDFFSFLGSAIIFNVLTKLPVFRSKNYLWQGETERVKWTHTMNSIIHACVCSISSIIYMFAVGEPPNLAERMYGANSWNIKLSSFTLSYFTWDVLCCLKHYSTYGPSLLLHALVCGTTYFLNLYYGLMTHHAVRALIYEISTIFINLYWFELHSRRRAGWLKAWQLCGGLSFLIVRLVGGSFLTYQIWSDVYYFQHAVPLFPIVFVLSASTLTNVLNLYWFIKQVSAAI